MFYDQSNSVVISGRRERERERQREIERENGEGRTSERLRVFDHCARPYPGERMRARAINKRRVPVKVAIKGVVEKERTSACLLIPFKLDRLQISFPST